MEKQVAPKRRTSRKAVVKAQVADAALVARRRDQIVAAAIDLFAAQGYDRTTMLDVARKAGVSVGLIYQYAQTKEDVLFLSLMSVLDSYKQEIPRAAARSSDPFEALWNSIEAYARIIDRRRSAALLAYRSTKSLPRGQRAAIMQLELDTNELLGERVKACVDAGLFRQVDVDLTAYQIVLHAHGWALKHWRLSQIATFDAWLDNWFDALIRACATPKGMERHARFLASRKAAPKVSKKLAR
jgi:AcrR family transcriptional regulator